MILVDDAFAERLRTMNPRDRYKWLVLEEHPTIENHWIVGGFDPHFLQSFNGVLKGSRLISPFSYPRFEARAGEMGYEVAFIDDPTETLLWANSLSALPEIEVASSFPDTICGFLPFQLQGYNFVKDLRGSVLNWSTGTGKTVLAAGLTKYNREKFKYDVCLWVVKKSNKINTQRALETLVGLKSEVVDGTASQRSALYDDIRTMREWGAQPIVILNYEKFRDDEEDVAALIKDQRVFIVWDEMPTKLKTRNTKLYKAVVKALYKSPTDPNDPDTVPTPRVVWENIQASEMRQVMLSATPIENSPEDFFNCVRLLDPEVYSTVQGFYDTYVRSWNQYGHPRAWRNLDVFGATAAHITHQVDKSDPDIAAQFPEVIEETLYVDMGEKQQRVYDALMKNFREDGTFNADFNQANILAKIGVAQMIVNHPMMAYVSARNREAANLALSEGGFPVVMGSEIAERLADTVGYEALLRAEAAKLDALRDLLDGLRAGDKALIFSVYNQSLLPYLSLALKEWKYKHVVYSGSLNMQERQEAEDQFKNDPDTLIFLSSDAGSDSLNFELANHVIHYDLPWKWSTLQQRQNRAHRITSRFQKVRFYTLLVPNTVEDRRMQIIRRKAGFHSEIFKGAVSDQSENMRLTKQDLLYILGG